MVKQAIPRLIFMKHQFIIYIAFDSFLSSLSFPRHPLSLPFHFTL